MEHEVGALPGRRQQTGTHAGLIQRALVVLVGRLGLPIAAVMTGHLGGQEPDDGEAAVHLVGPRLCQAHVVGIPPGALQVQAVHQDALSLCEQQAAWRRSP